MGQFIYGLHHWITGLPKVKDFLLIMMVVDRFSKYASFSPAPHACTAEVDYSSIMFEGIGEYRQMW